VLLGIFWCQNRNFQFCGSLRYHWRNFWLLLFPPYVFLARSIYFLYENAHGIFGFYNPNWVFLLFWGWKNEFFTNSDYENPNTLENRARSLLFLDYRIRTPIKHPYSGKKQFGLYNLNCFSTNSKHICNLNN